MSEYKDTLNLPETRFPMKANLSQAEPKLLQHWEKMNLYQKICQQAKGRPIFTLHDGPPYANGAIHIGHAVNKILKDIVLKSKRMSGFAAPYIPGWDCHGLPIEHNVEKKVGKVGAKVDVETFHKKCREYASKQIDDQRKDFKRLGIQGDWEKPYLTMDKAFEADIVRALGKIIEKGHIIRGYKPVYWSVVGGSALAEAEVEYHDKTSFAIDVSYPIVDVTALQKAFQLSYTHFAEARVSVVIWTTTPWTLPSSQAVTVGEHIAYALVECKVQSDTVHFVVASELLENAMARMAIEEFKVIATTEGKQLEHIKVSHPFYEKQLPIILGNHVTLDAGTGCVHTAPDHGVDDFYVCKRYGIETLNYLDDHGVFKSNTPIFSGQHVYKVDQSIIDVLTEGNVLRSLNKINHSYPHCWRTKTPLIYRATPQWFISMTANNLLNQVNESIKEVSFVPNWGRNRMESILSSSPDWCISRQRTWGTQIPLLIDKETGELHPETPRIIETIAKEIEHHGMEVWHTMEPSDLLPKEEAANYQKVTDTLDVWFDSGVSHQAVIEKNDSLQYPADLYLEGSDQHRGWFQSSLKTGVAICGKPPYRALLTHGFVVDGDGRKMSKSLGNVISPQVIMNKMGADVLRLWTASTDYTTEMTVSEEILKRSSDVYRRIRNTVRFLLSNLNGFDPQRNLVPWNELLPLDQWAIHRAFELQNNLITYYDNYNFVAVCQSVHHFCALDMGGFFLDIIKDRQYTTGKDSLVRRSCQTAMYHIVEAMVRWISPILSFTAEEIWLTLAGEREASVHLATWYQGLKQLDNSEILAHWDSILQVKTEVNKALESCRRSGVIGGSLEANVILFVDESLEKRLAMLGDELHFVFITSEASVAPLAQAGDAIETEISGLKIQVVANKDPKCVRCWHRSGTVGQHAKHVGLCERCINNIEGTGEIRHYV